MNPDRTCKLMEVVAPLATAPAASGCIKWGDCTLHFMWGSSSCFGHVSPALGRCNGTGYSGANDPIVNMLQVCICHCQPPSQ